MPFTIDTADGRTLDILVRLETSPAPRSKEPVLSGGAGTVKRTGQPVVVVILNGSWSPSQWSGFARSTGDFVKKEVEKVLMHELTHIADPAEGYASGGSDVPSEAETSLEDYYNQPTEVRAYLQEIIHELERHRDKWDKFLRLLGPTKGFKLFMRTSQAWLRVSPHLTEKNRRYILKSVSQAFSD